MSKQRFKHAEAMVVARELFAELKLHTVTTPVGLDHWPNTHLISIVGSLRRLRPEVSDVEILYVPKIDFKKTGLFGDDIIPVNIADNYLESLIANGILSKRANVNGHFCWGEKNKLAVHVATGIPVDFFAVLPEKCPFCSVVENESQGNTAEPSAIQTEVRCMPEVLRGKKPESVQQNLQHPASMERAESSEARTQISNNDLPVVQKEIPQPKLLEGSEGVFQRMRQSVASAGNVAPDRLEEKGEFLSHTETRSGIRDGLLPGEAGSGKEKTVRDAASPSDGKASRTEAPSKRTSSPPERDQRRQPIAQSGSGSKEGSHGESDMSTLSKGVSNQIVCQHCTNGWWAPNWFVSLVIRTGSKELNLDLTMGAIKQGATLNAYGSGVTWSDGTKEIATSEEHVFKMCGVKYREARDR